MSRYDKYDPMVGNFRAPLAAAWGTSEGLNKIFGVGLDTNGRVVKGAGNTGILGVLILTMARAAGEIVDIMTHGEIVEAALSDGTTGLTAGTTYFAAPATGLLTATESAGTNEVQTVTVDATGGTFTLAYDNEVTSALAFNVSAADMKTALEGLPGLQAGDVATVTGGPGDAGGTTPYVVTFGGRLAGTNVIALVADGGSLTGGAGTATVATQTAGAEAPSVRVGHTVEATRLVVNM